MDYSELVEVYERLDSTTKRLEKTYHISRLLSHVPKDNVREVILMSQGKVFPTWDERKIGVASKLVLKALYTATGITPSHIEQDWKKTGDLGETAENLVKRKKQNTLFSHKLTVKKVFNNIRKLAELEGQGTVDQKTKLIAELLTSASPKEARYIIRTILEDMRIGIGEGAMRDAILWAYFPKVVGIFHKCECEAWIPETDKCPECAKKSACKFSDEIAKFDGKYSLEIEKSEDLKNLDNFKFIITKDEKTAREAYNAMALIVQSAYDITNDFSDVVETIVEHGISGLKKITLDAGRAVKVMLAQKVANMKDGFEKVGKPCAVEFKYDGFRMQVHRKGKKITIYTRRLENVTKQFPEVVQFVEKHVDSESFIIDCEAAGYSPETHKYLPFQSISQRIRRKYDIEDMAKKYPVELNVFDIIFLDGQNMLNTPFIERRKALKKIVREEKRKIVLAKQLVTENMHDAEQFYKESLAAGNEGVMLKNLNAPYKPGSRVGFMVKLKPVMETLDVVIIGAEWGEGKRSSWLSSFTVAVRDEDGEFLEIGKVGTGIKELEEQEGVSFNQLTELLKPHVLAEKGREVKVKPEVVIEVKYEEIQKSPTYSSGYALRFPRLVRIRDDRSPDECSTISEVDVLYKGQRHRQSIG